MTDEEGTSPEIAVVVNPDSVTIQYAAADTLTIPLTRVLPLIRELQEALRTIDPEAIPSYLNVPDSDSPDFSDDEVLISLYAETVEDEEEFAHRTLVMRRVMAAIYACSGIPTPVLKRMNHLTRHGKMWVKTSPNKSVGA
jgi:hypothetical protein